MESYIYIDILVNKISMNICISIIDIIRTDRVESDNLREARALSIDFNPRSIIPATVNQPKRLCDYQIRIGQSTFYNGILPLSIHLKSVCMVKFSH